MAEVAQVDLELPAVVSPTRLHITAELLAGDKHTCNDWTSWLYPAAAAPKPFRVPVFADAERLKQYGAWGVQAIPAKGARASARGI